MQSNRKKTVLLIDDSQLMRNIIKGIIVKNGFRVVGEAENGIIGVEKYKKLRPDIVTMDLNMDEADGLESLSLILDYDPNAKVVMVSASMGQKVLADEAIVKGAKAIITKPIDEEKLTNIMLSIAAE